MTYTPGQKIQVFRAWDASWEGGRYVRAAAGEGRHIVRTGSAGKEFEIGDGHIRHIPQRMALSGYAVVFQREDGSPFISGAWPTRQKAEEEAENYARLLQQAPFAVLDLSPLMIDLTRGHGLPARNNPVQGEGNKA